MEMGGSKIGLYTVACPSSNKEMGRKLGDSLYKVLGWQTRSGDWSHLRGKNVSEALSCFFPSSAMYKAMPRYRPQPRIVKTKWTTCTSAIEPPLPSLHHTEKEKGA